MENKIQGSKILITGGAGFIGSYVVEELLLYKPSKIFIIDNLSRGNYQNMSSFLNNPAVEFFKGEIGDLDLIRNYMSQSDYCFHLAALRINTCAADQEEAFDVMVKGTFNIVKLANFFKIKKLIFSSSASIYGLATHFPTPESNSPYDNKTFYGAAKLFGEQILRSYNHMYGLNYVALRYFNVYGPRMDTKGKYTEVMIKWLVCILKGETPAIYGDGSTTMDFIYVTDVARCNVLALLSDINDEVFNVGFSRETSLKELLELMLEVNNSKVGYKLKPESKVNPITRRIADNKKIKKMLNFVPEVALETGIKFLSEWYFNIMRS